MIIAAGLFGLCICTTGAALHYHNFARGSTSNILPKLPLVTSDSAIEDQIPTPKYLMANPSALRAAQLQCQNGIGSNVVAICDNTHEAESGLLAIEYQNAAHRKSP